MNYDANGLIVTKTKDGGDTCAEEGRFWFLAWFNYVVLSNYAVLTIIYERSKANKDVMKLLEIRPGVYVRNPARRNDPTDVSRDQLLPIIYYCAAYKDYPRLWRLFKAFLSRGGFAQNYRKDGKYKIPDQMWTSIGAFIRCFSWYSGIFYPLLYVFDLIELLGTLVWLVFPYTWDSELLIWDKPNTWFIPKTPDDVDDNNLDIALLAAAHFKPTLISMLHRVVWGTFRPRNDGNIILGERNNCLAALAWYHAEINQGNPEITELYRKPVGRYLKHFNDT